MLDIWGFLLQTLTASGVAVLLLIVKALFRDKLPPKWQFAVWGVLGIVLLVPAGLGGRYALFRWQLLVEVLKAWCKDFRLTRVLFPIPVLNALPRSITDWIFAVYVLGVVLHILKYTAAYIRLRYALRNGKAPGAETRTHLQVFAAMQNIRLRKVIEVPELPGAFVCGIFRPVLAIPADKDIDDKVLLHELLHLKHKDTFWSALICLFRCIHWCNPLLIFCANRAINDMEARCDQYVLERLAGEERRAYGHILLSMVNDRFAKTPGSTCVNNGGKNIRNRIEAIARFKKYPVGMRLVSVCAIFFLVASLLIGVQATKVYSLEDDVKLSVASAKSTPCTTLAGALDTYAKSILAQNGIYRIMCAPEALQASLADTLIQKNMTDLPTKFHADRSVWADPQNGYYVYNLKPCGKRAFEALLVMKLEKLSDDQDESSYNMLVAVQNLRVEKENGRWVVSSLEEFRTVEVLAQSLEWGCNELPGWTYTGTADDMRVDVTIQTVRTVDNAVQGEDTFSQIFGFTTFDTTPKPNARFSRATDNHSKSLTHSGTQAERDAITKIGLSISPVYAKDDRAGNLPTAMGNDFDSSSSSGAPASNHSTYSGWGPTMFLNGGGSNFEPDQDIELPIYYTANLYVNNALFAEMKLHLQEGMTQE